MIFIFTMFYIFTVTGVESEMGVETAEPVETSEQVEMTESKYPGLHLETLTASTEKYIYAIHSIKTDHPNLTDAIQSWIDGNKKQFINEAKENTVLDLTATLHIDLETTPISDSAYNLIFSKHEKIGDANGINEKKLFTINIEEGKIYKLADFIEETDENKADLTQIILEKIAADEALNAEIIETELLATLADFDNLEWAITDEALIFYWNEYEIAAGSAGVIRLELPFDDIKHLINEKGYELLQLEFVPNADDTDVIARPEREPFDPDGKYVALTFDDGPHQTVTALILDTLNDFDAKGTFFMLGNQIDYYPSLVQRVAEEGHEIGSHTETHPDLSKVDGARIKKEFEATNERMHKIIGRYPTVFRPPYGAYNEEVMTYATNYKQPVIMWSVDSLDWKTRNAAEIYTEIVNGTTNGSIILMHDIHEETAEALPIVLNKLKNEGYSFVTVSQLLEWRETPEIGPHFGTYKK